MTFLLPSLIGGGAEFVAKTWASELTARGVSAQIALLRARPNEPEVPGVSVVTLAHQGAGRVNELLSLRRWIRGRGPSDTVVSMMTRANFQVLALARRGGPRIFISERNIPRTEPGQGRLHILLRDALFSMLYSRADALIAISHPVAAYFRAATRLPPSAFWVVPNPAVGKFAEAALATHVRARTTDAIDVVVPARVVDAKRPWLAVQVCDELSRRGVQVSLTFLGEGELRDQVAATQRAYTIRAPGRVERWFDLLTAQSVVLLTSEVEGFANVLVEAAAAGVPSVVGSVALGSADAVVPGLSGFFARGEQVEAYADAVVRAAKLDSPLPRAWLREFSPENSTDTLEQVLATPGAGGKISRLGTASLTDEAR